MISNKIRRRLVVLALLVTFAPVEIPMFFAPVTATAQEYVESKQCGRCKRQVAITSRVGQQCPYCGVRWGYENQQRRTEYRTAYAPYPSYESQPPQRRKRAKRHHRSRRY